jgi:hypothetical protein
VEYESRLNRSKDTKTSLQEEHLAQQIQKLKQAITRLLDCSRLP